jgi:hypothetical protein
VRVTGSLEHRLDEAPLRLQPVVVSSLKISERMRSEEIAIDALAGGLPRHRLCTVLTKLGEMTLITLRPRTTRAIKALALVNQRKCP